jgi:hypothetical protein
MSRRVVAAVVLVGAVIGPACASSQSALPACNRADAAIFVLAAQAVPSSTKLPCINGLPAGWTFGGSMIQSGFVRFWLDSNVAGIHAVEVDLTARCDTSGATEVPPSEDEAGTHVFQAPTSLPPRFAGTRYIVFSGGCLASTYSFAPGAPSTMALEADAAVSLLARRDVVSRVADELDETLCGAGAPPCVP